MSIFIAIKIPQDSVIATREAMRLYQDVLVSSVPQERWHATILYLGNAEISEEALASLAQSLPQKFHPVIKVLSLGEGKAEHQLWAYIQPNQLLDEIRSELMMRIEQAGIKIPNPEQAFVPHIHVGNLEEQRNAVTIPDAPIRTSFSLRELVIFRSNSDNPSTPYEQLAIIPVTP